MSWIWNGKEPDYLVEAHQRSAAESQKAVDEFIAYRKAMNEPFTEDELTELFKNHDHECRVFYELFTDSEKQILERLGLTPSEAHPLPADEITFRRRRFKREVCGDKSSFFHRISPDSDYEVHFVRDCYAIVNPENLRILDMPPRPDLVVEKAKLRPDQIEFLELECKKKDSEQ